MALNKKQLRPIERVVYKHDDDLALSIARLCERLQEHMDSVETRINTRISGLETNFAESQENIVAELDDLRNGIRETLKF